MRSLLFILFIAASIDSVAQNFDFSAFQFRHLGPYRGGRVTAVAGSAQQNNVFYMGSTGGGVWKTEDYGISWNNISDPYFKTPSIGAISVCDKDPNIIYVGTGSDGLRSNVISGKGIYKSKDEGSTWEFIGLKNTGQIGALEIHPSDPSTVYVAAIGQAFQANEERGVYKTVDGGTTWKQVLSLSDTTGFADLEFAPDQPNTIYAAAWRAERKPWTIISGGQENGIYKSDDAGASWNKIDNGLPKLKGKIDLAVSKDNPDLLYALIEARDSLGGLYKSRDRGLSFEQVSYKPDFVARAFYYTNLAVDPQNADKVYIIGTGFHLSNDGGKTWKGLTTPHIDHHDLWINPLDSNLMIQSNDGGANVSTNGGLTWSHQFNQSTAEIYQVEVDNQYPYWLYGGQQDNYSAIAVPSLPPHKHQAGSVGLIMDVGGCETGPAVPHPTNPDIVYANCKGRFSVYNKKSGQEKRYDVEGYYMYGHNTKDLPLRFQRVAPIHISPHDPSIIYHCSQYVHKTLDEGKTWEKISPDLTAFEADKQMRSGGPITNDITGEEFYSTIYSIQESKISKGHIWVGANDGPIHLTTDGGLNWANVSPKELPSGGRVDGIEPSQHKTNKAYVTALRYQLGDWKPYIYKTEDNGLNWKKIVNGIPDDHPVRVIREDPNKEGVLYAGTEYGLFISLNDGEEWQSFQNNLPITPITDLKIHRGDLVISSMGRGFWMVDNIKTISQIPTKLKKHLLFEPKDTYRYRYKSFGGVREVAPSPKYPVPGVLIDYYLKENVSNIKLEVYDDANNLVRSIRPSKSNLETKYDMSTNQTTVSFSDKLNNKMGMHRFIWDMRHFGPWDESKEKAFAKGPLVSPGTYKVRLLINKEVKEQSFELKLDPRIQDVSLRDCKKQEDLALQIVDLISKAKKTAADIIKHPSYLDNPLLVNAYDKLVRKKGSYTQPQLISQIQYLSGIVNQADQIPGNDAFKRFEQLKKEYEELLNKLPQQFNKE